MIYWELIEDFDSACKIITYMTFEEYNYILHKDKWRVRLQFKRNLEEIEKIELLKDACRHYCELKKLDSVYHANHGTARNFDVKILRFGDNKEYVEFYYIDEKKGKKRVCGYPIKGKPYGYRCLRRAGYGTLHYQYGHCMEHEALIKPNERQALWVNLRLIHRAVPSLIDLLDRAKKIEELAIKDMSADLTYLEISRQAIMMKIEAQGGIPAREHTTDLTIITETIAKVKALKVKTEAMNWIPPEQVSALILQVLDAITKNETDEVRKRIAARAKDLSSIIVPRMDNREPEPYERDEETRRALEIAENHIDDGDFTDISEVQGYKIPKPITLKSLKPVPNYKKNHRFLKVKDEKES